MLLFDDSKKLEKALGEEAATVIAHIFEQANEKWRQELATKADLEKGLLALPNEMKELEIRLTIRLGGMMAASIALVAALVKLL
ncbi:MAG: hypothetical protein LBV80_11735 [Deltaproteobacteria bacterium]|jgi:hypothetical protein|nr:hypothetical protein [Deltaproteobacteria bacterium]